jgi:hypothetical protein
MAKERRSKTGARLSRQPDVMRYCNLAQCEHACRRTGHARDMQVMHGDGAGGPQTWEIEHKRGSLGYMHGDVGL